MEKFLIEPIGYIKTPFKERGQAPRQTIYSGGAKGQIKILDKYKNGLKGLERFKHIMIIFYFHKSKDYNLSARPPHNGESRGVFATRSPHRPNPLGFSVVQLLKVGPDYLRVSNVDMIDGTPIVDIKPYIENIDKK